MNNNTERLSFRAKEYVSKYMQELRELSKSFLEACDGKGKNGARAQLFRLRRIIERMDSNTFKTRDRKFVLEAKEILLPSYEQALKLFNQGDWGVAREKIEDALVDTLTIESVTLGWHEPQASGTRSI